MELELKHVSAYLPYGLQVEVTEYYNGQLNTEIDNIDSVNEENISFKNSCDWYFNCKENDCQIKPLLIPLSKLTEDETWKRKLISFLSNGESDNYPDHEILVITKNKHSTFKLKMYTYYGLNTSEYLEYTIYKNAEPSMTKYNLMQWYFENHIDAFNLIPNNLAVDKTTLVNQNNK